MKVLPNGNCMLVRDIKTALKGGDIYYFEDSEAKRTSVRGFSEAELIYYFRVFQNTEEFGMPHGGGWLDELPSTIQLITQLRYIKKLIEVEAQREAMKGKSSAGSLDPKLFEG